ncbi:MAG: YitT family protein [Synergistaceae bacterium]|jgi:uncharacterized membrane protein YczE|nr:YitT family protein [Synergistaceae bacterium]
MFRDVLRVARLLFGLFLYALGIVLTLRANLGYSPWDAFHQGLAKHLHLTIGVCSIIVSIVIVIIAMFMKEQVGIGTLCNSVFIGLFVDMLLFLGWIPIMNNFVLGVITIVGGLFVIGFASFLYIGASYGSGPRDSLMVILTKRTGCPVGFCRACVEGTVLCLGWALDGSVGIGTVISVFGLGVAVQTVFTALRFDVRTLHQESLLETWARLKERGKTNERG